MLMFMMYMINFMFLMSCLLFSFNFKHILLTLISLEFMMINTIYLTYNMLINKIMISQFFLLIFLSLMISEGIMGLTILVYMIRLSGNDYTFLMNLIKW